MPLGERVKIGGRFIEQEDGSIFQQGTRNRQPLAFPATETKTAFTDDRFITLRQPDNEIMDLRPLRGVLDLEFGRRWPGQEQILTDGIVKEIRPLGDDTDHPPHILLGKFVEIVAIEQNPSLRIIPEAQQKISQRGLPRPTRPDNGNPFSGRQVESNILQSRLGIGRDRKREIG